MSRSLLSGLAALIPLSLPALAQIAPEPPPTPMLPPPNAGDSVLTRPRPDYDALGIRLGSFMLHSELAVDETYDDNIYALPSDTKSDFITTILPTIDLRSDWNNHALNFHADGAFQRYADHTSEDTDDFNIGSNGRIDITRDARLLAGVSYRQAHEARYSPNDVFGKSPTVYDDKNANAALEKEFARLSLHFDVNFDQYTFGNVANSLNQTILEDTRNESQMLYGFRTGYELSPGRQIYVAGNFNERDYRHGLDVLGFERNSNSHGFQAGIGTAYDITGVTAFNLFVGYREQDYRDPLIGTLSGPTGFAQIVWDVTRLTSVTAGVQRDILETILPNTAGYFATTSTIAVNHELLRNLILNASIGYEDDNFGAANRDDNSIIAGFGARYLMNRNISVLFNYNYRTRSSNVPGVNFDDNAVSLRLSLHV